MVGNQLVLEQRQTLSESQIQSLELLAYTNQELEEFLLEEYLENPMLEHSENKEEELLNNLEQIYERGTSYKEQYEKEEVEDYDRRGDAKSEDTDEVREYIMGQLDQKSFSKDMWNLMEYLILCLDEQGFFTYEKNIIANVLGVQVSMVEEALSVLKELEPVGIFSENTSECIKRQLEAEGNEDPKLIKMVEEYMPEILKGHIGQVSRALHLSTAKVKEYICLIGKLNPRPIMNIRQGTTQYIIPDMIAEWEDGQWLVRINEERFQGYKYNEYYINLMKTTTDEELKEYFLEKLKKTRFIFSCIEQRRKTLVAVVTAVLEWQSDFFRLGKPLKPMTMEDISIQTGLHPSTVSRAIKGKYIQYKETVSLRELFSGNVLKAGIQEQSPDEICQKIKHIIEAEGEKPLSDQMIAKMLQEEKIEISRRTVAKYRIQMGIPDSRERKFLGK